MTCQFPNQTHLDNPNNTNKILISNCIEKLQLKLSQNSFDTLRKKRLQKMQFKMFYIEYFLIFFHQIVFKLDIS